MCWSPTADLIAGGAITAVGVLSLASVRRGRDVPMAAIPLILGAHQLIETVVWRNAGDGMSAVGGTGALLWVIIAFPLLAGYVPLAVFCAASQWSWIRIVPFVAIGLATCAVLAYAVASEPVMAQPFGHTMRYGVHHVYLENVVIAGYLVATLGALLVSDQPELRLLGVVTSFGALGCFLLWKEAFVSTWCALAAVASVLVLHWLRRPRRRPRRRRAGTRPIRSDGHKFLLVTDLGGALGCLGAVLDGRPGVPGVPRQQESEGERRRD